MVKLFAVTECASHLISKAIKSKNEGKWEVRKGSIGRKKKFGSWRPWSNGLTTLYLPFCLGNVMESQKGHYPFTFDEC